MDDPIENSLPPVAVVTGASSGIGIEFARELIQLGYDLILVGRDRGRLQSVQEELKSECSQRVEIFPVDLMDPQGPESLLDFARGFGTTKVLVNNAGVGQIGNFLEQDFDVVDNMLKTNVNSLVRLCHLFGRDMAASGSGHILNHSSFSAIQAPSSYAVYAASKSFVLAFSEALRINLASQGVSVTALCSGYFDTEFIEKMGQTSGMWVNWLTMDRKKVARAGVRGLFRKKAKVIPGLKYKLFHLFARVLPRSVTTRIADFFMGRESYRQ